jgi:hypothetical protein
VYVASRCKFKNNLLINTPKEGKIFLSFLIRHKKIKYGYKKDKIGLDKRIKV